MKTIGLLLLALSCQSFAQTFEVVSHKGLHIPFAKVPGSSACVASYIDDPAKYAFGMNLENTAAAVAGAFADKATMVSINIRVSADGIPVLFHDATLDCRTNLSGPVNTMSLAGLQMGNIGWNYTADGGKTFPWRDAQVPRALTTMPTLDEILKANPGQAFFLVVRAANKEEGEAIFNVLANYPASVARSVLFADDPATTALASEMLPALSTIRFDSWDQSICLNGFSPSAPLPGACANLDVILSLQEAMKLDANLDVLSSGLAAMNSKLYVGGENSGLVDDAAGAAFIKAHQSSLKGLMTDRIDIIGPMF